MPEKQLHVGFLTSTYIIPPNQLGSGLALYIQKVGRELVRRGHRVSVFYLSEQNHEWEDMGMRIYEVDSRDKGPEFRVSRVFPAAREIENNFLKSDILAKKVWEDHAKQPINIIQTAGSFRPFETPVTTFYIYCD